MGWAYRYSTVCRGATMRSAPNRSPFSVPLENLHSVIDHLLILLNVGKCVQLLTKRSTHFRSNRSKVVRMEQRLTVGVTLLELRTKVLHHAHEVERTGRLRRCWCGSGSGLRGRCWCWCRNRHRLLR